MAEVQSYLDSLKFKLLCAQYHYEKAKELLINPKIHRNIMDEKTKEHIALCAEFNAMMHVLHSCLDILAQWANDLKKKLPPKSVSLNKLIQYLSDEELPSLHELHERSEYLTDFVNVSKHRKMIGISTEFYFISASMPVEECVIQGFEKDGRKYNSLGLSGSIDKIFNETTNLIKKAIDELEVIEKGSGK
jgi:hypothetical protein